MVSRSRFIAVKKNDSGKPIAYKTDTGKVYDYEMAIELANYNLIDNARVINDKKGNAHVIGKSDGVESYNFDELPEF